MTLYDSFANEIPLGVTLPQQRSASFSNTAPGTATFPINAAFDNTKALKIGEVAVQAPG